MGVTFTHVTWLFRFIFYFFLLLSALHFIESLNVLDAAALALTERWLPQLNNKSEMEEIKGKNENNNNNSNNNNDDQYNKHFLC